MAFFHKSRGFLLDYLHVLCCRMITRHIQIKSKPILERRMIALINERDILMITYTFYAEKWQSIEKNWSKIHFFLKSLSSPSSRDLDQDIWQIIFKLNLFRRTLVRFTLSLAEAAPEGGAQVLDHPVYFAVLTVSLWKLNSYVHAGMIGLVIIGERN